MKRNITLVLITSLLLALLFVFFSSKFRSPESTMTPPRPNAENAKILEAFRKSIGNNTEYQLKYPNGGKYHNAFIQYDLNGDGTKEVLVFYSTPASELTRINILACHNGKWASLVDREGYGSDIDSVDFRDLSHNGQTEVILSWNEGFSQDSRRLTVHQFSVDNGSKLKMNTLLDQEYRAMGISDMDRDGLEELLIVWNRSSGTTQQNIAALFKLTDGKTFLQYGKTATLDHNVSGYRSLRFQEADGTKIAVLDADKGERSMITEVLFWDASAETLRAPFTENDSLTNTKTFRAARLPSRDIDQDGMLEIPLITDPGSSSNATGTEETELPLVCWYSVSLQGRSIALIPKTYTFLNTEERFFYQPDAGKEHSMTAVRGSAGVTTFYASGRGGRGEPLFSIVVKDQNAIQKDDKYTFRTDYGNRVAFGTITSAGCRRGITDATVENAIKFY